MIRFFTVLFISSLAFAAGDLAGVTAHIGGTNQGGYGAGGTTISAGDVQTDDDISCDDIACDDITCDDIDAGNILTVDGITITDAATCSISFPDATTPDTNGEAAYILGSDGPDDNTVDYTYGGTLTLQAGNGGDGSGANYPGDGGMMTFGGGTGGASDTQPGTGGETRILGGAGGSYDTSGPGGDGGDVTIYGGSGLRGSAGQAGGTGGDVILRGGGGGDTNDGGTAGASGNVQLYDDIVYVGLPDLSLPSYNQFTFAPSTGDATAGGLAYIKGCSGSAAETSGNGGAAGPTYLGGGTGGAAHTSGDGGAGGSTYIIAGTGGAGAGGGATGATGAVVLGYNGATSADSGNVCVGKAAPTSGVELDVDGDIAATTAIIGGATIVNMADRFSTMLVHELLSEMSDPRLLLAWTYWASDTTEYDFSGCANDATLTALTESADKVIQGWTWTADMDGSAEYAVIADADDLSFGNGSADSAFTVFALMNVSSSGATEIVLRKGSNAGHTAREWSFGMVTGNKPQLVLSDASANKYATRTADSTLADGWHFVVITYDGTGGATACNGALVYVDGAAVASTAANDAAYVAMENLAQAVGVGASNAGDLKYSGQIGVCGVEASAWTAATVRRAYWAIAGKANIQAF